MMATVREDSTCVREGLALYGEKAWGLFFYRTCYYDDDARWETFLERMKAFARRTLLDPRTQNMNGDGQVLPEQLEWNIHSDPSLENCSYEEIWRRHRELMKSHYGKYLSSLVRHGYPIVVDKEALDSVLEGPEPDTWTPTDRRKSMAYVNVLDMQWFGLQGEQDSGIGSEVGWTRVSAFKHYPRLYSLLQSSLWVQCIYRNPPTISRLS